MSWKKPALSDGPSTTAADEELQLAWKRPRLALQEDNRSTAVTGKSWKKLSVSSVSSSLFRGSGGAGAGANHLVWHSVSVDEPTLSLIKCEDTPMTEYKKKCFGPKPYCQTICAKLWLQGILFHQFSAKPNFDYLQALAWLA